MKKFTTFFLFLSFVITFFYVSSGYAEVYKWIDSSGEPHYSDQPPEDQKKAEIIKINVQKADSSVKAPNALEDNSKVDQAVKNKLKDYQEVKEHNSEEDLSTRIQKLKESAASKSTENSESTAPENTNENSEPSGAQESEQPSATEQPAASEQPATTEQPELFENTDKQSRMSNKNCVIAQQNLKNLKQNKIILNNHNHKLIKLSDTAHAKKIAEAQKHIKNFC